MASFKAHISFGAICGVSIIVAGLIYGLFSASYLLIIIFAAALCGSFLPDIDSDEGLPFQILIYSFSLVAAALAFFLYYYSQERNLKWLIAVPVIAFGFVRFGLGAILKKFTHHRGMFHSIPALLIACLATLLLINRYPWSWREKLIIAAALGLGYLSHLILDEWKSFVNFRGIIFKPKKSLGSALKLFSSSKLVNIFTYGILLVLIIFSFPIWKSLIP